MNRTFIFISTLICEFFTHTLENWLIYPISCLFLHSFARTLSRPRMNAALSRTGSLEALPNRFARLRPTRPNAVLRRREVVRDFRTRSSCTSPPEGERPRFQRATWNAGNCHGDRHGRPRPTSVRLSFSRGPCRFLAKLCGSILGFGILRYVASHDYVARGGKYFGPSGNFRVWEQKGKRERAHRKSNRQREEEEFKG